LQKTRDNRLGTFVIAMKVVKRWRNFVNKAKLRRTFKLWLKLHIQGKIEQYINSKMILYTKRKVFTEMIEYSFGNLNY